MCQNQSRHILFITKGEAAASTYYRAKIFFPFLEQAGWVASHVSVKQGRLAVLTAARRADQVVVVRRCFGPVFRRLLRRYSKHLYFDFDDAIFVNTDGSDSPGRQRRFESMLRCCDGVWAGNPYLADYANKFHPHVNLLPTSVDPTQYDQKPMKPADHIDLVWIGSSSTRKYLERSMPMLDTVYRQIPRVRLKIVADFDLPGHAIPTLPVQWTREGETQAIASSHLGIAPLAEDNRWTRGKCGLKTLQYMAAGLPVVGSNVGVQTQMISHGQTGYLVKSQDQWAEAIVRLADNQTLRERLGQAGRQHVCQAYRVADTAKHMMDCLV